MEIMFNKSLDTSTNSFATDAGNLSAPSRNHVGKSVFASDLKITGDIIAHGDIEMAGDVEGTISAKGLTIVGEGRMKGAVTSETLEVKGALDGTVASGSFTLRATAQVTADVSYQTLVIESGAQIEGRFNRTKG